MEKQNVTRLRDLRVSARDQFMIDPRIIVIEEGHNPRDYSLPENRQHLDGLKESIKQNGTISPLWVRYDQGKKAAILVDGECRLRANLELIAEGVEIEAVPCIQVSGGNEPERLLLAITANTGKQFSRMELGYAFQRLIRFGWTEEKIAQRSGYPLRLVREAMELADAPEAVKEMVSAGEVTPAAAVVHVRKQGAFAVDELKKKIRAAEGKPITRTKAMPMTKLEKAARKLLEEFTKQNEMDEQWIAVSRENLIALRKALPVRAA
jgi:ParB/RepB/Spo0J family partition protein